MSQFYHFRTHEKNNKNYEKLIIFAQVVVNTRLTFQNPRVYIKKN
jgi:hypothetical protein